MKSIVAPFIMILCLAGQALASPSDREARWRADLDAYATELEAHHIDLFHALTREDFNAQLGQIRADISDTSDTEIVAELMKLTHSIGDGHTAMPLWNADFHRYPIALRWVEGKALITATASGNAYLLGANIVSWNGIPIDKVYARLAPYVPFVENPQSEAVRVTRYLPVAQLGQAIGLSQSAEAVNLMVEKDGVQWPVRLEAISSDAYSEQVTSTISYRRDLSSEPGLIETQGIRFAIIEDGTLGYFQFDAYPQSDDMVEFSDKVYRALEAAGTRNIAIDFRENFGGNFFVGLMLAADLVALDGLDWQKGVYVLTSGTTFSAAMSNSAQFADILNARLIGEPTGANPCGYQDMGQFSLPYSGYLITYSKRHYCFSEAVDDALQPDVPVAVQSEDYVDNRDRALDWIISDIRKRTEN